MKKQQTDEKIAYGIVGTILGVLSGLIFFMPYFGLPLAIAGVIFGALSKNNGLRTAALILNILSILVNSVILLFLLVFLSFTGL